ncbi:PAS domain S-box-containing protein [Algoriphagus ratkowskyi]|uniref:histidine kinase n=1 Tax=Algoriphagus ratkowskyi TaxID=57028 RepID=A0A2W7RWR6_9BACT|nr:PAS domain S-box protein [Algoriphagus ratkowskyi]PZX55345.1 PAS domain S-box-containing protein [Algoriphagus ratkowskyi]TXD79724.1 PAS domain S-box protein [Algoriphagus ratkowskyi]
MKDYKSTPTYQSEYRFQRMIEEVQDYAIILMDEDGTIQNWNKGAQKIKGYNEQEIIGKNFSLFYLPEDQKEGLPGKLINEAKLNGRATHEGWRVRKDGTTFWGFIVITALHDEQNNVIGFTKVTRDLTERKLAEEQKERDAKSIEMQNKRLEEFAYVTSHDLQEPIRKIRAFTDLAKAEIDDREKLEWYLGKIDSSAAKMVQLIKDVLAFSKLSHDHTQFIPVDLNAQLLNVLSEFEVLISEKQAVLEVSNLPVILGVPVQIHQLLSNLISNAIKFNRGIPHIYISCIPVFEIGDDLQQKSGYQINFRDNGIGFDQKYAQKAFEPFERLSSEFKGTGIGLALCKRISENHKGSIKVQSEPGQGSTFSVFFPELITE